MPDAIQLVKTGPNTANVVFSVFRIGSFITHGQSEQITISIEDNPEIRLISANLTHMKTNNFPGLVTVKFDQDHNYQMDQSIWHELADALFAFSLCVDIIKLGV